jgi:hypothetical protein
MLSAFKSSATCFYELPYYGLRLRRRSQTRTIALLFRTKNERRDFYWRRRSQCKTLAHQDFRQERSPELSREKASASAGLIGSSFEACELRAGSSKADPSSKKRRQAVRSTGSWSGATPFGPHGPANRFELSIRALLLNPC